jgi:RNA-directed DNA polymerase
MFNPVVRGWLNYYGRFYKSSLYPVLNHLNRYIVRWAQRKFKKFRAHRCQAAKWLGRIARQEQSMFAHWQMGMYGWMMGAG